MYKNFPLVISERWQAEVSDTVFDTINHDYDKVEHKKRAKAKKFVGHSVVGGGVTGPASSGSGSGSGGSGHGDAGGPGDERDSDCILHGYVKKQGGPFGTAWQTRSVLNTVTALNHT